MQRLKQLYRSNYGGENIITAMTFQWNTRFPTTEFVPNSVYNTHTTSQAVAIGNGESRKNFDLKLVIDHIGGLGGCDSLQSYGCNAVYRNWRPDFLIAVGDEIVKEIAESNYCDNNIVYANAEYLLKYPNKFYMIPQNVMYDAGAIAAYMACFDGHKKVFLIGYDGYDSEAPYNNLYKNTNGYLDSEVRQNGVFFARSLEQVILAYPDVDFVRVMPTKYHWAPVEHTQLLNFRQITYQEFIYEADIGMVG